MTQSMTPPPSLADGAGAWLGARPDLTEGICTALERSDSLALVLDHRAGEMFVSAANARSCDILGNGPWPLVGEKLAVLLRPDAGSEALDALLHAAHQARPHRGKLQVRTQAGERLWLGVHLMPAEQARQPGRFLLLGSDITARTRERAQGEAAQSLLAKVFVSVDVPIYIMDQSGRFVMTNPALERLLGVGGGALAGTQVLDCYAPSCHAAIAAARAQQDVDGRDYRVAVTLQRAHGPAIGGSISGTMVHRQDLTRFRIITVHLETAQGEAAQPDPPAGDDAAPVQLLAGGHVQLVGLTEVRRTLGAQWPALRDRAMETAAHIIRHRLGPRETFTRTDDEAFAICFVDVPLEEARFRAVAMGREIRQRLIGAGERPEAAHVVSTAAALPPDTKRAPASDFAATVRQRIEAQRRELQQAARAALTAAVEGSPCQRSPVLAQDRLEPLGQLLRLSVPAERAFETAFSVLPAEETAELDADVLVLLAAQQCGAAIGGRDSGQILFATLSAEILLVRRRLRACMEVLNGTEDWLRKQLVLVLTLPPDARWDQLTAVVPRLRPLCRSLGVASQAPIPADTDCRSLGIGVQVMEAAADGATAAALAKVRSQAARLQTLRCRLLISGARRADAVALFAAGAMLVSADD